MVREPDIINPLKDSDWDRRVLAAANHSFFHSSNWARVLHESYGYKPLYFTSIDAGRILALIPCMEIKSLLTGKRAASLPFTDYCEPILDREFTGERISPLLNGVLGYGKNAGWDSFELRSGTPLSGQLTPSCVFYGHTLDLSRKEEEIFSAFRDGTKRNIQKAVKEGVEVGFFHSMDSVAEFYRLHCRTRREHGLPPQPYRFFEKLHEHVLSRDRGFVALASHGNIPIAGGIYLHFGKTALFKYGASDRKFQHLRANNLIMWEAIRRFSRNGYKTLCFGRTDPDDGGLLQYKRGWGARERTLHYYKYDVKREAFVGPPSGKRSVHHGIFRRMPIPLLRITGSLLYKHMG